MLVWGRVILTLSRARQYDIPTKSAFCWYKTIDRNASLDQVDVRDLKMVR